MNDGVDALHGRDNRISIVDIPNPHIPDRPRQRTLGRLVQGEGPHPPAGLDQGRNDPGTHGAGRARNQDQGRIAHDDTEISKEDRI